MRGTTYKRCICTDGLVPVLKDDGTARLNNAGQPVMRCPKLRQSKHGSWFYDIRVEGRRYRKGGFAKSEDAQSALDLLRRRLGDGDDVTIKASVGEWLEEWLAGKRNLRAATRRSYRQHLDDYLLPHIGDVQLEKLRPAHISRLVDAMVAGIEVRKPRRGRNGEDVGARAVTLRPGPASIRRVHATLRSALNAAVKQRRIPYNPALHVELPEASRPKVEPWSVEDLGAFLDAVASDRLGVMYEVMAFTGLRRGEALGLRWIDVDLEHAVLFIRQQLTDQGFGMPKTKDSEARVDLDEASVGALMVHRLGQDVEREQWGDAYQGHGLVFCRPDGSPLRPEYATRHMQRIAKQAGLPRKRLHDLRHGSASLQIAAGVDLAIVSKRLRHSSISITNDTYVHLLQGVGHDAAERARAMVPRSRGPIAAPLRPENDVATLPDEAKPQVRRGAPPGTRTPDPLIKSAGEAVPDEAAS